MPARRDTTRRLEFVPLDDLVPSEKNPKRHNEQVIGNGIAKFGLLDLPVIDERTGRLVAGHGRRTDLLARKERGQQPPDGIQVDGEGRWLVPTVRGWRSRSDHEAHAAGVTLNQATIAGGFDDADLAGLVSELAGVDAELVDVLGFDDETLAALLAEPEPVGGGSHNRLLTEPDDIPEQAPSLSKAGDVWVLGDHRLACGDATNVATVRTVMGDDQAALVWTDPPYAVGYVGKTAEALTIENDNVPIEGLRTLLSTAFLRAAEACAPGATWFVTGPPGPLGLVFGDVLNEMGLLRQTLVWVKDVFVLGHSDYHYRHEPLFYGWLPSAAHRPTPDRTQDTVWEIPRPKSSREHPTMKPVALIERAITNHTNPNALVYDPFGGSGSTLVAAQSMGRRARLVEIDPHYCDVICKRYQQATGIHPERDGVPHDFLADEVAHAG